MPSLRIALAGVLLASSPLAQERVGYLASQARIDWHGAASFAPDEILRGALLDPDAPSIAHPSAPRAAFVGWLRARIERGYRFAGFRDVRVAVEPSSDGERLAVRVEEGVRRRAGAVRFVDAAVPDAVRDAVVRELAKDVRDGSPLWSEGGSARFGEEAWIGRVVLRGCANAGALAAAARVRVLDADDGTSELAIALRDAELRPIGALRLEGVDDAEAARIVERIGFDPRAVATAGELRRIEDAIEAIGRYRSVRVERDARGIAAIDPMVVRLEPVEGTPGWDAMPFADLDAMRRGVLDLVDRFRDGAHVEYTAPLPDPDDAPIRFGPGLLDLRVSRDELRVTLPAVRLDALELGDCVLSLGEQRGLLLASERLGPIVTLPPPWSNGTGSLALLFSAELSRDPGETFAVNWGFGFSSIDVDRSGASFDDAAGEQGIRRRSVRLAPTVTLRLGVSGAFLAALLRGHGSVVPDDPRAIRFASEDGTEVARIDRGTGRVTVDARDADGHLRFVDHAMPELDRSQVARGDASRSDAWRAVLGALARSATTRDAVELGVIAGRVGFDALAASIRPAGDRVAGFVVPSDERTAGVDELRLWALAASRAFGSSYPPESWPCVLSRDLPWLFVDAPRGWGPTWLELQRLLTEDRAGPLGWWIASAVLDLRGAAEPARMTAGWAGRRCTFERFWQDVEVLCGSESPLRAAVLRVGAAWRLRAAGLSPATAAAMAAAADDLAAARIGAEVLWNAGLGDLLRHDLAKRAAPR